MRVRSNSTPALPYIVRFSVFKQLISSSGAHFVTVRQLKPVSFESCSKEQRIAVCQPI
jgi:hypothetical protein